MVTAGQLCLLPAWFLAPLGCAGFMLRRVRLPLPMTRICPRKAAVYSRNRGSAAGKRVSLADYGNWRPGKKVPLHRGCTFGKICPRGNKGRGSGRACTPRPRVEGRLRWRQTHLRRGREAAASPGDATASHGRGVSPPGMHAALIGDNGLDKIGSSHGARRSQRHRRDPAQVDRKTNIPCNFAIDRWRHLIEILFCDLKQWRRIATRYA
jgi:hypothetical protein